MNTAQFDMVSKDDLLRIAAIIRRARRLGLVKRDVYDGLTCNMDLSAAHSNGCPLDFAKLLAFPRLDFTHDICGIARHMDRNTGKLTGHFLPRCAK